MCKHANISSSHLLTLNDLPTHLKQPENIRWILVDHNKLQGELGEKYSKQVYGVIDHHDEENAIPKDTGPEPRIVEKCGSCTSLAVRYCKSAWDNISSSSLSSGAAHAQGEYAIDDGSVTQGWDAQIAKMALASILVDTANLTAPGKVEQVDREAVEYLEVIIHMSARDARGWSRDGYYKELDEAKRDIGGLTLREILTKDYKQWTENGMNLGMSSVVKPLEFLVQKAKSASFEDEIRRFMDELDLSIFAIMTTSTSAKRDFQRELLVHAKESAAPSADRFIKRATSQLGLEKMEMKGAAASPDGESPWPAIWNQTDVSKSRKQVAPLLREAMRDSAG